MKFRNVVIIILSSLSLNLYAKERIPGTKVLIDPPKNFVKATQFPGYMMESTSSSIMVTPIPGGPFSEVSKGFTSSGLAGQGMKILKKEKRKVGSVDGVLIYASQSAYGTEFLKWMLAFGDKRETTLVVATFPKALEGQLSEKMKNSILSTEWNPTVKLDYFEGVTFRVSESKPLEFGNKVGNNVFLTKNGIFPQTEEGAPFVVMGSSASQDWNIPTDKKTFSYARLKQTKVLGSPKIFDEKKISIDGLDGYMIYAVGTDKDTGKEMYIEQCLLFSSDGYYIFQAMVGSENKSSYTEHFKRILQSFTQK